MGAYVFALNRWERFGEWFLDRPLRVLCIFFGSMIAVWFARRAIDRFGRQAVRATTEIRRLAPGTLLGEAELSARATARVATVTQVMRSFAVGIIWTIAMLLILGEFHINLGPLLAGAGVAGVALGFGAQSMVGDYLAGAFLIIEDQYGVGDFVDIGTAQGKVEAISLRTTQVRDVEGTLWHVPNGEIRGAGNKSQSWARAVVDIPLAASTNIAELEDIVDETANAMVAESEWAEKLRSTPELLGIESFSSGALTVRISASVEPSTQWDVERELRARMVGAFREHNIEVAPVVFPSATDGGTAAN